MDNETRTCSQRDATNGRGTCGRPAAYRYTWPGRDEDVICEEHSGQLRAVAVAMGLHLQLIPVAL